MGIPSELVIVFALALVNGVFAGAEIAILSVRKTRLRELADEGSRAANAVLRMRDRPERFLATIQIGITVVGATAGAFGGHTLARAVARLLEDAGVGPALADDLGLVLVVVLVSYLSLVLGELVPKSLALRGAERYALAVAHPLRGLSWIARPLVWFLTASSNVVLRPFRDRTTFTEARLSKEELQQLVEEATTVGSIDPRTGRIVYRALDFGDVRVGAVMVPRREMVTLPRNATRAQVAKVLVEKGHERIPVREGDGDEDVVGYVTARDLLGLVVEGGERALADVVRPALFVPESNRAADVLAEMQAERDHLALVIDEAGTVIGLVTIEDLVEELVGEIFAEHEKAIERIRREPDGSVVVRGRVPVHEVNRELGIELPEGHGWTTVGGLATALAGAIPREGQRLVAPRVATLEVLEVADRRVLGVRIIPIRDARQ